MSVIWTNQPSRKERRNDKIVNRFEKIMVHLNELCKPFQR